jgi:hypothetical protein
MVFFLKFCKRIRCLTNETPETNFFKGAAIFFNQVSRYSRFYDIDFFSFLFYVNNRKDEIIISKISIVYIYYNLLHFIEIN